MGILGVRSSASRQFMSVAVLCFCYSSWAVLASAQDAGLAIPEGYKNSVGFGAGGGESFRDDAPNLSITVDYSRDLDGPWGFSVSIGYDKEYRKNSGRTIRTEQYALQAAINYELTERFTLTGGVARGLIERKDNGDWESSGSDDWSVGGGIAYSIPINERVSFGPSLVTGYSFDNKEFRAEFELNISYAF